MTSALFMTHRGSMRGKSRLRVERARGRGSSPVRDRLGQRADQCAGRGRARGAGTPRARPTEAPANAQTPQPPTYRSSRRPTDSRSACSPSSREGGSSWTSSRTTTPSPPRTHSTRARSSCRRKTAAIRDSMRVRHGCSSTSAADGRGRGQGTADVRRGRFLRQRQCVPPAPRVRQLWWAAGGTDLDQLPGPRQLPQHDRLRVADGVSLVPAGAGALHRETERQDVMGGVGRGQQFADRRTPRCPARPSTRVQI